MATSEARVVANRRNAQKSTGPKTELGKAASCRNAFTHGMTAALVPHPDDQERYEQRVAGWSEELGAVGDHEQTLIASAALALTIQERAQATEAALSQRRVTDWAAQRGRDLDERIQNLEEALRHWERILSTPREDGQGFGPDYRLILGLLGDNPDRRPTSLPGLEAESLHLRVSYHEDDLFLRTMIRKGDYREEYSPLLRAFQERQADRSALQPELTAWLARQRDRTLAILQDLRVVRLDCEHATPPVDAWLDLSREAEQRRRYGNMAGREFHRKMREFDEHRRRVKRDPAESRRVAIGPFWVQVPMDSNLEDAAVVEAVAALAREQQAQEPARNEANATDMAARNEANATDEAARNEANATELVSSPRINQIRSRQLQGWEGCEATATGEEEPVPYKHAS